MTEQALQSSNDRKAMAKLCPWLDPPVAKPITDILTTFGPAED